MSSQETTITSAEEKDQFNDKGKSSSQFFHFVRLMELFPNVHPATLHTVLNICKNDFFLATDRLLYAKRCKEMGQARKNFYELMQYKGRCVPYASCNGNCNQTSSLPYARPQVIKVESKKVFTRNKSKEKCGSSNQIVLHPQQQQSQESPFTYQYKSASSPILPEDLSSNTTSG